MTEVEEKRVLGIIAGLLNAVHDLQHGHKLMTDAFVSLESRMNQLEAESKPKSSIIVPGLDLGALKNGKAHN
jgi:hypothetical protein